MANKTTSNAINSISEEILTSENKYMLPNNLAIHAAYDMDCYDFIRKTNIRNFIKNKDIYGLSKYAITETVLREIEVMANYQPKAINNILKNKKILLHMFLSKRINCYKILAASERTPAFMLRKIYESYNNNSKFVILLNIAKNKNTPKDILYEVNKNPSIKFMLDALNEQI